MNADVDGDARDRAASQGIRRAPLLVDQAPANVVQGFDRPPDPTPVIFMQCVDDTWLQWTIVEVDAHGVPGAHGARCLIFTRRDCIRRVWGYPADWRALDDDGLAALSWHR